MHVMHVHFMFFAVLKNLKSSFLEDNVPEHALDIFIENATKMVWVIPLNLKNGDQTLRQHQNSAFFLYNAMKTIGVRQGMSIMYSGVMDTVFHSCDALDSLSQN